MKTLKPNKLKMQETISTKNQKDKKKLSTKINSPSFKQSQSKELKNWKSQKSLSFLSEESCEYLQLHSILEDSRTTQMDSTNRGTEGKNKTHMKKLQNMPSQKISSKIIKEQQDKTKKHSIPQSHLKKEESELKAMKLAFEKLEAEMSSVKVENGTLQQEIQDLKQEKAELLLKIEKQEKLVKENKKLMKTKIDYFNQQSEQIKKLKERIQELQTVPNCIDVGLNTDLVEETEPLSERQEETLNMSSIHINSMVQEIKEKYEKKVKFLSEKIIEQEEEILDLQKELNQLYSSNKSKGVSLDQSTDKLVLEQLQTNLDLKAIINSQETVIQEVKLKNKKYQLEIESLEAQLQVQKQQSSIICLTQEDNDKQVTELQGQLAEKVKKIEELESTIFLLSAKSMSKKSIIRK